VHSKTLKALLLQFFKAESNYVINSNLRRGPLLWLLDMPTWRSYRILGAEAPLTFTNVPFIPDLSSPEHMWQDAVPRGFCRFVTNVLDWTNLSRNLFHKILPLSQSQTLVKKKCIWAFCHILVQENKFIQGQETVRIGQVTNPFIHSFDRFFFDFIIFVTVTNPSETPPTRILFISFFDQPPTRGLCT